METPSSPPPLPGETKPGTGLLILTICLVAFNVLVQFAKSHNAPFALGYGMSAVLIPLLIALLFSIAPRFRNDRARTKIVLWTSVVILVSQIAQLGQQLTPHP